MSSSPGFGARISGAGVYQLNSLFSMNAGLGISRQTFTEKFIDEGSDSWGSYRDVVEVSIALNMVDLNLGATLRPWRNLVVGLDGGYWRKRKDQGLQHSNKLIFRDIHHQ
jgi:hypothetical protein